MTTHQKQLYIGEGFDGPGINLAHISVLTGPRNGPAGRVKSAGSTRSRRHSFWVGNTCCPCSSTTLPLAAQNRASTSSA